MAERLIANALDGVLLATTTSTRCCRCGCATGGSPSSTSTGRRRRSKRTRRPSTPALASSSWPPRRSCGCGHRRIGAIFGPPNTSTAEQRELALRTALLDHRGLTIPAELSVRGPFDFDTGSEGPGSSCSAGRAADGDRLRERRGRARRAQRGAGAGDHGCPTELSVVGFDDLPAARWALVRLTTVKFDLDAMARRAAQLLVRPDRRRPRGCPGGTSLPDSSGPARHARRRARFVTRTTLPAAMHTHTLDAMPLDPIAYKPYADPDEFIREVTDLIWVDRAIGYHPAELRAGLDRARRLRHHRRPGRGDRGQPDADRRHPRPDRSGRGRGLGGPRGRRLPELAPGACPPTRPTTSSAGPSPTASTAGAGWWRSGWSGTPWPSPVQLGDDPDELARRKAFRGYSGQHDASPPRPT